MTRVFTYGTLLAGEPNHRVLRSSRCLGAATTLPQFTLVDLGAFPGMLARGATAVQGEIYEVDDEVLAALDRLEGHPTFYTRVPTILAGWKRVETYLFPVVHAVGRPVIASGSWRAWLKQKKEHRCAW